MLPANISPDFSLTGIYYSSANTGRAPKNKHSFVCIHRQSVAKANDNLNYDKVIKNSINYAEKKSSETVAGKITKTLPSLFNTLIPLALGALQKGPLSSKIKTGMSSAAIFIGADILFSKYDKTIKFIEKVSPKFEEKRKRHPAAFDLTDFALKTILLAGSMIGITKSSAYLQKKFQPAADKIRKTLTQTSKKIDSSAIGKKSAAISTSWTKFKSKHKNLENFTSKYNNLAPIAIMLSWLGLSSAIINKDAKNKARFATQKAKEMFNLNHENKYAKYKL